MDRYRFLSILIEEEEGKALKVKVSIYTLVYITLSSLSFKPYVFTQCVGHHKGILSNVIVYTHNHIFIIQIIIFTLTFNIYSITFIYLSTLIV